MKINREELLEQLQSVRAGLSQKDIIEQSSCFVFKDGRVYTFNDEVACSRDCQVGFDGAVRSKTLLELLTRLKDDELDISLNVAEDDGSTELRIVGKGRRSAIRVESEITLPLESIEAPEKWRRLPEDFCEGVAIVKHCADKESSSHFCTTCVHISPTAIEATDNYQVARYMLKTGFKSSVLARRDAISPITDLGVTAVSETQSWLHFKSTTGLIYSCRKYVDQFPNIDKAVQGSGKSIQLPKSIVQAVEVAEIFSSENADNDQVRVDLTSGKVKITGRGNSGWYSEVRKASYAGPDLSFDIQPELLIDIVTRHNECKIGEGALRVESGKFLFATALGK